MSLTSEITRPKLKAFLNLVLQIAPQFEHHDGFQLLMRKVEDGEHPAWINAWCRIEKKLYRKLLKAVKEEICKDFNSDDVRVNIVTGKLFKEDHEEPDSEGMDLEESDDEDGDLADYEEALKISLKSV